MTPIFNGCKPLKMLAHPCAKVEAENFFLKQSVSLYGELWRRIVFQLYECVSHLSAYLPKRACNKVTPILLRI
jgi:hypothetical protein